MDRLTLLMRGVIAAAPYACSAATVAEPLVISRGPQLERWQEFVSEASSRFEIPESWIYAVMDTESNGETMLNGRPITSHTGAMGLMQVMPKTYQDMRRRHDLGRDPHDPRDNILAGTAYLRAMYDRFGYPALFAAYHAGPGRYGQYVKQGKPLPTETISYLKKLERAGVSVDGLDSYAHRIEPWEQQDVPSGRSLFFLRNGAR